MCGFYRRDAFKFHDHICRLHFSFREMGNFGCIISYCQFFEDLWGQIIFDAWEAKTGNLKMERSIQFRSAHLQKGRDRGWLLQDMLFSLCYPHICSHCHLV
uniref:Uncharacterized protein n=1 Tax=Rhizophora mucronata TaxID=61149 RepID=A0A2P2JKB8_RHIMU